MAQTVYQTERGFDACASNRERIEERRPCMGLGSLVNPFKSDLYNEVNAYKILLGCFL